MKEYFIHVTFAGRKLFLLKLLKLEQSVTVQTLKVAVINNYWIQ